MTVALLLTIEKTIPPAPADHCLALTPLAEELADSNLRFSAQVFSSIAISYPPQLSTYHLWYGNVGTGERCHNRHDHAAVNDDRDPLLPREIASATTPQTPQRTLGKVRHASRLDRRPCTRPRPSAIIRISFISSAVRPSKSQSPSRADPAPSRSARRESKSARSAACAATGWHRQAKPRHHAAPPPRRQSPPRRAVRRFCRCSGLSITFGSSVTHQYDGKHVIFTRSAATRGAVFSQAVFAPHKNRTARYRCSVDYTLISDQAYPFFVKPR